MTYRTQEGNQLDVWGLPRNELGVALDALDIGAQHSKRVFKFLHGSSPCLESDLQFGPSNYLRLQHAIERPKSQSTSISQCDSGTRKIRFTLHDGLAIESVLIPRQSGRFTLCISSQIGCGMSCSFCATGTLGLKRQLTSAEIIRQFHEAKHLLQQKGDRISHVVFMGMGEPLQNYQSVKQTIDILTDTCGPSLAAQRITVSTVGIQEGIARLAQDFDGRIQLALSLHAGTDQTRQRLIPLAKHVSMDDLKRAVERYPVPGSRRVMVEYVLLPGINDHPDELSALAKWTHGLKCLVNFVPFNPFEGGGFRSPTADECRRALNYLRVRDVPATVRWPRGRSVDS